MSEATKKVKLHIDGMRCAGCVASIEKALSAVPGVTDVSVQLLTKSALLQVDQDVPTDLLIQAIESNGFSAECLLSETLDTQAPMQEARVIFHAEGIACAACAAHIERALKALDGVQQVSVNVPKKQVIVRFDPYQTEPNALMKASQSAGYPMAMATGKIPPPKKVPLLEAKQTISRNRQNKRTRM